VSIGTHLQYVAMSFPDATPYVAPKPQKRACPGGSVS